MPWRLAFHAPLVCPEAEVSTSKSLWPKAMCWAYDSLNGEATAANPERMFSHDMRCGKTLLIRALRFLKPCLYSIAQKQGKHLPREARGYYRGPGINHLRACLNENLESFRKYHHYSSCDLVGAPCAVQERWVSRCGRWKGLQKC